MCDYSLHAVASRPAQVGETLITTTFPRTTTRGFASESEPEIAVCMLPGTELAFAGNVKYQSQWLWPKVIESRVGKFSVLDPQLPQRHHDAIEFPDGSRGARDPTNARAASDCAAIARDIVQLKTYTKRA